MFLLASGVWFSVLAHLQASHRTGGHVRKGEHGTKVVFWKIGKHDSEDADGETVAKTSAILRYYTVFNVEQCEASRRPVRDKRQQPD